MRRRRVDDDGDEVLADGETLHVPIHLMDGVQRAIAGIDELATFDDHRCGFRLASDADRAAVRDARAAMIQRLTDAWRMDARRKPPDDDDDDDDDDDEPDRGRERSSDACDARAAARAARDAYVKHLTDAWRTPQRGRDGAEPDMSSSAEEMRAHLQGAPGLRAASDPDIDGDALLSRHLGERVQAARDRVWSRYRDGLANAWRTDPSRAAQVEGRLEREKHGLDAALEE